MLPFRSTPFMKEFDTADAGQAAFAARAYRARLDSTFAFTNRVQNWLRCTLAWHCPIRRLSFTLAIIRSRPAQLQC